MRMPRTGQHCRGAAVVHPPPPRLVPQAGVGMPQRARRDNQGRRDPGPTPVPGNTRSRAEKSFCSACPAHWRLTAGSRSQAGRPCAVPGSPAKALRRGHGNWPCGRQAGTPRLWPCWQGRRTCGAGSAAAGGRGARQGPPPGGRGNCAPRAPPAQDAPARLQACGPGRVASEPCRDAAAGQLHSAPARQPRPPAGACPPPPISPHHPRRPGRLRPRPILPAA